VPNGSPVHLPSRGTGVTPKKSTSENRTFMPLSSTTLKERDSGLTACLEAPMQVFSEAYAAAVESLCASQRGMLWLQSNGNCKESKQTAQCLLCQEGFSNLDLQNKTKPVAHPIALFLVKAKFICLELARQRLWPEVWWTSTQSTGACTSLRLFERSFLFNFDRNRFTEALSPL